MAAISARKRFRILARDGFACRYCGARAPTVALHVDHVVARVRGGSDDDANLVASCATCNLGKCTDDVRASATVADSICVAVQAETDLITDAYRRYSDGAELERFFALVGCPSMVATPGLSTVEA